MNKISKCRVCHNNKLHDFFDLGMQPPANSLIDSPNDSEDYYPLSLSWCPECNLVQLNHTIDPKKLFSKYVWVTATSKTANEHAVFFYNQLINRTPSLKNDFVLEIASNDGTFLKPFQKNGFKVLGVDPAENIVATAIRDGVPSVCGFFGETLANKIVSEHKRANIIFARNVVPHVANLHDFIKGLDVCLNDDGLLVIEVHYADIILKELHYDSIYHEHLCYFTLKSIERLLNSFGFYVFDLEKSPISGGSLILYIRKEKIQEKSIVQHYRDEEIKTGLNDLKSWKNFANKSFEHKENLNLEINKLKAIGLKIAGYGASARSSTLLNFCNITSEHIDAIADQNPLKQNKYTAGTHIKICNPDFIFEGKPDYVILLAWNFTDEIIHILKSKYNFRGQCIIPLPNDPKIILL